MHILNKKAVDCRGMHKAKLTQMGVNASFIFCLGLSGRSVPYIMLCDFCSTENTAIHLN